MDIFETIVADESIYPAIAEQIYNARNALIIENAASLKAVIDKAREDQNALRKRLDDATSAIAVKEAEFKASCDKLIDMYEAKLATKDIEFKTFKENTVAAARAAADLVREGLDTDEEKTPEEALRQVAQIGTMLLVQADDDIKRAALMATIEATKAKLASDESALAALSGL